MTVESVICANRVASVSFNIVDSDEANDVIDMLEAIMAGVAGFFKEDEFNIICEVFPIHESERCCVLVEADEVVDDSLV